MKKFLIVLALAFGFCAMQSCKCTSGLEAQEFVYDVTGVAEGVGSFSWGKGIHSGEISLDGRFIVTATNDTTSTDVFTVSDIENAVPLSAALTSEDREVAEAAQIAKSKLYLDLALNGLTGKVELSLTGYVRYGMMVFALDEHWQYPPVSEEAVETVEE